MDLRALNVNHCLKNLKCPQILQFIYEISMRCFLKFDNTLKSCMLFSIMNVRQELLKCKRKKPQQCLISYAGENTHFTHRKCCYSYTTTSPTGMAIIKFRQQSVLAQDAENLEPSYMGIRDGAATEMHSLALKLNRVTYDL